MDSTIDNFLNTHIWINGTSSWESIIENTTTWQRCQYAVEHLAAILEKERYEDMLFQAQLHKDSIEGELV